MESMAVEVLGVSLPWQLRILASLLLGGAATALIFAREGMDWSDGGMQKVIMTGFVISTLCAFIGFHLVVYVALIVVPLFLIVLLAPLLAEISISSFRDIRRSLNETQTNTRVTPSTLDWQRIADLRQVYEREDEPDPNLIAEIEEYHSRDGGGSGTQDE